MKYIIFSLLFIQSFVFAQEKFLDPLNIPMYLSGSFAELRANHFHSGIDIKTNEQENLPVFAVQDGWVSRIKVSPWGFGHAIYITHYNGYTSVYAHLNKFNKEISNIVLKEQYRRKRFSIDKYFKKGEILIKQSDTIAFSGNTGGSGGPHLHFELRETASQKPINPLQFNFDIIDTVKPIFRKLVIYNGANKVFYNPIEKKHGEYWVKDTITINDNFEVGIVTKDESNFSKNRLGVNIIQFYLDNKLLYSYKNEKFSFSETRYANSHIDYEAYKKNKIRIQKMFVDPGNKLTNYSVYGKYKQVSCGKIAKGRIEIYDSKNNKSLLYFIVKRECSNKENVRNDPGIPFKYNQANSFRNKDIEINIPKGALYTNIDFKFDTKIDSNFIGHKVFLIHENTTALQKKINIKILKPQVDKLLERKLVIVKKTGKSISAKSTKIENGFLVTRVKEFGDYSISIDTLAPKVEIKELDFTKKERTINIKITDNLSGISSYNGYIDGVWILFKYDYKNKRIYYDLDNYVVKKNKQRNFLIKVIDSVGNITQLERTFLY